MTNFDFALFVRNLHIAFDSGLDVRNSGNVNTSQLGAWSEVVGNLGAGCWGDLLLLGATNFVRDIRAASESLKTIQKIKFLQLFVANDVDILAMPTADLQLVLNEAMKHIPVAVTGVAPQTAGFIRSLHATPVSVLLTHIQLLCIHCCVSADGMTLLCCVLM